jgi:hypothetical protein
VGTNEYNLIKTFGDSKKLSFNGTSCTGRKGRVGVKETTIKVFPLQAEYL